MSNYTQNVFFTAKDSLITGDANKKIKGSEMDAELAEIASTIATKEDSANRGAANGYAPLNSSGIVPSANLPVTPTASEATAGLVEMATTAEAAAGVDTTRAVTAAGIEAWASQNAAMVKQLSDSASPGADRILFWDQSASALGFLSYTGMTLTGTVLSVDAQVTTNASLLTSGTLPDARIQVTGVTQHQASLSIAETQIADGSVFPRLAASETVGGTWTFTNLTISGTVSGNTTFSGALSISGTINKSGAGKYPYFGSATQSSGIITIGTAAVSGTPAAGDIYIQHAV